MNWKLIPLAAALLLGSQTDLSAQQASSDFQQAYYRDGMYFFDGLQKIRQQELFTLYKSEFGLGQFDDMRLSLSEVLDNGTFNAKYELYHKDIPVEGSAMNVLGEQGIVLRANGFIRTGLNVDADNVVPVDEAVQTAIDHVGAITYLWDDETLEEALKEDSGDPNATNYPTATLVITKMRGENFDHTAANYQLCYKVTIHALEPEATTDVYVNANTGAVYTTQDAFIEDYTAIGTQWTWYNGWHNNIKTRSCGTCFNYWLHDMDRNIFTTKYGYYWYAKGGYNKDNNNNWVENDTKTASSSHWGIERSWEYYINRHGRWGTDYAGRRVHVQTDRGMSGSNAAYNFDGDDNIYVRPDNGHSAAMLDVLAHEYTHGMIHASSNLGVLGDFEASSLNEAYADIFGVRVEAYTNGWIDWTFAENMGTYQRNFADPHTDYGMPTTTGASPARYLEPGYWSSSIHANGGVMRKWFHLLANGGTFSGYTVSGLGLEKVDDIAYITFNWWLWSNLKYTEAASQTVHATVAHWGKCSNEHKQTVRALRAVGFNVPTPYCGIIIIDGPVVVASTAASAKMWKVRLNDIDDATGTFNWVIPAGWDAVANGNTLTLNSVDDFDSKELQVSYTKADGQVSTDKIAVHFSDEDWQAGTPRPAETSGAIPGSDEALADRVRVYPNPAATFCTINLNGVGQSASVDVLDINGKYISNLQINGQVQRMDVSNMPNGVYLLKIKTADKLLTRKLTVVH